MSRVITACSAPPLAVPSAITWPTSQPKPWATSRRSPCRSRFPPLQPEPENDMHKQSFLAQIAFAASAVAMTSATFAQTPSTPTQSGSMAPAGQGPGTGMGSSAAPSGSTRSRAAVAAKTRQAETAGNLQPAGEAPDPIGGSDTRAIAHKSTTHHRHHKGKHHHRANSAASTGAIRSTGQAAEPMSEPKK